MAGKWSFAWTTVLAGSLLVSLFSGCGDKNEPEKTVPKPAVKVNPTTAAKDDSNLAKNERKTESPSEKKVARPKVAVPKEEVKPEVWTLDFPKALAKAKAEHRPMLITGGSTSCGACVKMEKHLNDRAFQCWVKGTGFYLVRIHTNIAEEDPDQLAGFEFLKALPSKERVTIPHIGVYWPRETGEPLTAHFRYERGNMPGKSTNPAMIGELAVALETVLADFFKGQKRITWDEILVASKKKIVAAVEGKGEVKMFPANGELVCGKELRIMAQPAIGYRIVGWKGPDGQLMKGKRAKVLSLPYISEEGTYTAVFKK